MNYRLFEIQSNLCVATTLGTRKKWSLLRGGRNWVGQMESISFFSKNTKCY